MRISYLWIDGYKNLSQAEFIFDTDSSITAIIGNNGSGKSNLLEAISIIFSDIVSKREFNTPFSYRVKYFLDSNEIEINNIESPLSIKKNAKIFSGRISNIFPKAIFLYYAGGAKGLEDISNTTIDKDYQRYLKNGTEPILKFLPYLTADDFDICLIIGKTYNLLSYRKVKELLGIRFEKEYVELHFKRPFWSTRHSESLDFFNAKGVVRKIIEELDMFCDVFDHDRDTFVIGFNNPDKLKEFNTPMDLFIKFKALKEVDIINLVHFEVTKNSNSFLINSLSEGERQLAMLLILLEITADFKTLFMLDEFDSFLHPNWQRTFIDMIKEIDIRGQILLTTHSPLTLSKIYEKNIVVMQDGKDIGASSQTYNRNVGELLEELMGVSLRPKEIERMIKQFRNFVAHSKKAEAEDLYEELKGYLSLEDPFHITAKICLDRMK